MKNQKWYSISSYEIGLECLGEWKMDCPLGTLEVRVNDGQTILKIPSERFYIPFWNALYFQPEQWNNPLITSHTGRFIMVHWFSPGWRLQPLLIDLERKGGFRFDSHGTPNKVILVPGNEEITFKHHLIPDHADRFQVLKNWEFNSEPPTPIFSGGFETFKELFGPQDQSTAQKP